VASGAGAEMRHALGTAVFSGMLGVTLFGIFLTPIFFYVLQWFGRPPAVPQEQPLAPPTSTAIQLRPEPPRH
jgi:multidrug efflux pump